MLRQFFIGFGALLLLLWGNCYWKADQLERDHNSIQARVTHFRAPGAKKSNGEIYYEFEVKGTHYVGKTGAPGLPAPGKLTVFYCTQRPYLNTGVNPDGGTYRLVANTAMILGAWTLVLGGLSFIAWLSQSDALGTKSAPKDDLPEIGF